MARAMRGARGIVNILPPLRVMVRVRCPRSNPEVLNVGVQRFTDPEPVQCEQTCHAVVAATGRASLYQEDAQFVAVTTGGIRFVVQLRARRCTAGDAGIKCSSTQYG